MALLTHPFQLREMSKSLISMAFLIFQASFSFAASDEVKESR